jgi:cysteine desulfurase/selenocysteine lyase
VDERCVYLDNASTTWPKPPEVAEAMSRYLVEGAASPGRGGYRMAARNAEVVARLRGRLASMIGAEAPERVVLTSGATDAINTAIMGLFVEGVFGGGAPTRVVTTVLEHNAVRRPLAFLRSRGLVEVVEVGCDDRGWVPADAVLAAVDDRTVLVVMATASNVTGQVSAALEVSRRIRAERPHALVLLDGSQTVGLLGIDVRRDGVDLLAFPSHKTLMGPTGLGGLYLSARVLGEEAGALRTVAPSRFGGTGVDAGDEFMTRSMPKRFEPGTANAIACAGLLAALESPGRLAAEAVLAHERALVGEVIAGLGGLAGVRVLGDPGAERVGLVSFVAAGWSPADLAGVLDASFGIAVRAGVHCAPGAHRALGTFDAGGSVRVSPGVYNTRADVGAFLGAMRQVLG